MTIYGFSSRTMLFSISIILFQLVRITIAQPDFSGFFCSQSGNYSSNSTYQANLNRLLSSLSSNTEIDYGFYNFSSGEDADKVNAIALCRGDVTLDKCHSCVNDSIYKLTQTCPYQKEAIGWYDYCMLRYSDRAIFGTVETGSIAYLWNPTNASNMIEFNQALGNLLNNLQTEAASGTSLRKFATGDTSVASYQRVFALVQCTPDLTQVECHNCLVTAIGHIVDYSEGKIGGRVFLPSCNLEWEMYQFYGIPPPQPSTPTTIFSPLPPEGT